MRNKKISETTKTDIKADMEEQIYGVRDVTARLQELRDTSKHFKESGTMAIIEECNVMISNVMRQVAEVKPDLQEVYTPPELQRFLDESNQTLQKLDAETDELDKLRNSADDILKITQLKKKAEEIYRDTKIVSVDIEVQTEVFTENLRENHVDRESIKRHSAVQELMRLRHLIKKIDDKLNKLQKAINRRRYEFTR
eukprot:3934140-Rhodomonas_salina.2